MDIKHHNYNFEITLYPFLDIINHKTWSIDRAKSIVRLDLSSNNVVDIISAHLLLNTKQEIIVCKKMRHTICNQVTLRPKCLDQLLLIIRGKSSIDKSQVIKAISQAYDIIDKGNSIFITAPTRAAANNISRSILHTALRIDTWKIKETVKGQQKMEKIWRNMIAVIMDEMNMVSLDLLVTVDLHFSKAKALYENLSTVLGELPVVIFLDEFFQFSLVIRRSLWKVPLSLHKKHGQHIWHYFTDVITLTK